MKQKNSSTFKFKMNVLLRGAYINSRDRLGWELTKYETGVVRRMNPQRTRRRVSQVNNANTFINVAFN